MNLRLATVVGNHLGMHLGVFDQMLRHYRDLGVESIVVSVQPEAYGDAFHQQVEVIVRRYNACIENVFVGKWTQYVNAFLYQHMLGQSPQDWFIIADTDEFQVYPDDVNRVVQAASDAGCDYVSGFVIDRISSDGKFPEVTSDRSLWDQFPLAGFITYPLLKANILKVVAAKGSTRTAPGQHYAYNGTACSASDWYIPVHHFKWTAGLLDRLRARVAYLKSTNSVLWPESERLVRHCDRNGGKIDITHPAFMLRSSGRECPHFETLKAFALRSAVKMPMPP